MISQAERWRRERSGLRTPPELEKFISRPQQCEEQPSKAQRSLSTRKAINQQGFELNLEFHSLPKCRIFAQAPFPHKTHSGGLCCYS